MKQIKSILLGISLFCLHSAQFVDVLPVSSITETGTGIQHVEKHLIYLYLSYDALINSSF